MDRFGNRAAEVRDLGVEQARVGRSFFVIVGLVAAIGTAAVYWVGGYLVISTDTFSVGDIVAFALYLPRLYGPLAALANARVQLATSLVSFERVFEVLDLPIEIKDTPGAKPLADIHGEVQFDKVSFSYTAAESSDDAVLTSRDEEDTGPIQQITTRQWAL